MQSGRRRGRTVLALGAVILISAALGACREDEMNRRVIPHEPGTYTGEIDQPISEDTRRDLRRRAQNQRM